MTVDLFVPCYINHLFPNTAWSVVKILESCNIKVQYNPKHACCGQPTFNSGHWPSSREMAKKFLKDFDNDRPIIVPSASCAGFIINHYPKFIETNSHQSSVFERVSSNIFEFTDFMVNHLKIISTGATFAKKVTYHDGCAALREYGIKEEPRLLLSNVKGLELVEMAETNTCCGFGGTFMVVYHPISTAMAEQKVQHAINTGAEYIVSSEASCLININNYISGNKLPIKTIHLAEVMASYA